MDDDNSVELLDTELHSSELLDSEVLLEMLDPDKDGKVSLDRLYALASTLKEKSRDKQITIYRAAIKLLKATVLLAIIILVGIFSFMKLEHKNYEAKIEANNLLRADIEQALPLGFVITEILDLTSQYDTELDETVRVVYENYTNQSLWNQLENNGFVSAYAFKNPWLFESAAWFIFTIITTIGYGQVVPNTSGGYLFVIGYSIPAIICMGYFIKQLMDFYRTCPCKVASLKLQSISIPVLFVIYLAISGWLFSRCEGWTVTEGVYFTWVTISTIGFGDYAPGDQNWYQVSASLFLILNGLFLFSFVLTVAGNIMEYITNPERWREVFSSTNMHKLQHMSITKIPLVKRLTDSARPTTTQDGNSSSSSDGGASDHAEYVPPIGGSKIFL